MRLMRMSGVRGITAVLLMVVGADAWGLDPTWVSLTPMPTARRRPAVTAIGGTIYVVGGYDGPAYATILAVVEAYDTATGTWTTKAPLPVPTYGAAGASVGGTVYVMGGMPWTGFAGYSATLWAYDPATDTWAARAPMPTKRGHAGGSLAGWTRLRHRWRQCADTSERRGLRPGYGLLVDENPDGDG